MPKAPAVGHAVDSDPGQIIALSLADGDGHLGIGIRVPDHLVADPPL